LVGNRQKKSVWLDEGTIALVNAYARQHNLNFSRTIESLALIGLQDTKQIGTAWLAFNMSSSSQKSMAARRQRATLSLMVELQERMHALTRIVLALAATDMQIAHDVDTTALWNVLAEATGIATEKPHVLVEQILDALDTSFQSAAQLRLKTIVAEQLKDDLWLTLPQLSEDAIAVHEADGAE
jgi:hypothetical protein